jgi:hypothetical protein
MNTEFEGAIQTHLTIATRDAFSGYVKVEQMGFEIMERGFEPGNIAMRLVRSKLPNMVRRLTAVAADMRRRERVASVVTGGMFRRAASPNGDTLVDVAFDRFIAAAPPAVRVHLFAPEMDDEGGGGRALLVLESDRPGLRFSLFVWEDEVAVGDPYLRARPGRTERPSWTAEAWQGAVRDAFGFLEGGELTSGPIIDLELAVPSQPEALPRLLRPSPLRKGGGGGVGHRGVLAALFTGLCLLAAFAPWRVPP